MRSVRRPLTMRSVMEKPLAVVAEESTTVVLRRGELETMRAVCRVPPFDRSEAFEGLHMVVADPKDRFGAPKHHRPAVFAFDPHVVEGLAHDLLVVSVHHDVARHCHAPCHCRAPTAT